MHVNFRLKDGSERTVEAKEGDSVMRAAVTNGIPGIIGECGGEMNCGTCHVYVDPDWVNRIPERDEDEEALIEVLDEPEPTSRLTCQIRVTPKIDGLTVAVAE